LPYLIFRKWIILAQILHAVRKQHKFKKKKKFWEHSCIQIHLPSWSNDQCQQQIYVLQPGSQIWYWFIKNISLTVAAQKWILASITFLDLWKWPLKDRTEICNSKMGHPRCVYINNRCGYQSITQQYLKRCLIKDEVNYMFQPNVATIGFTSESSGSQADICHVTLGKVSV